MDKSPIEQLMDEVVENLLKKIRAGSTNAADIANCIRLMKDSGIRMDPSFKPSKDLIKDVPFSEDEFKEMLEG